jgi:hypothetical protein
LTDNGKLETDTIREEFRFNNRIKSVDLLVSSPHRRTIETAVLGFAGLLAYEDVKLHLLPEAQGVSAGLSNIGFSRERLQIEIPKLFEGNELMDKAATSTIYENVVDGWNSKVCLSSYIPCIVGTEKS